MAPIPLTQGGPTDGGNYEQAWEGEYVRAHFLSDVGRKRRKNEDSCIMCVPQEPAMREARGILFAVADGMGGASAGEHASRQTLETIIDYYYAGHADEPTVDVPARLKEAVETANLHLFEEAEQDPERHGMGTTVSVVLVHGDCAYIAQVGDSRVYVAPSESGMVQITDDHSHVADLVREGDLSEEEARNHPQRNLITRAVGIKDTVEVDLFAFRLRKDDTLLICSDGLSGLVGDTEIAKSLAMESLQGAARLLVGRALTNGGTDNVTAVLLRLTGPPPRHDLKGSATEVRLPRAGLLDRLKGILYHSH